MLKCNTQVGYFYLRQNNFTSNVFYQITHIYKKNLSELNYKKRSKDCFDFIWCYQRFWGCHFECLVSVNILIPKYC